MRKHGVSVFGQARASARGGVPPAPPPKKKRSERTFARCMPDAPGIQINVPATYPNAFPMSYRAWGALFTIAKAQTIHA